MVSRGSPTRTGSRASASAPTTTSPSRTPPTRSSAPWPTPTPGGATPTAATPRARSGSTPRGHDEPLRQLAQLRNLLVARSSLDLDAVRRVGAALEAIAADAGAWGRDRGVGLVATLAYHLHPDRVVLTLRDEAGWLGGEALAGRWAEVLQAARFDQVDVDETGRRVTFLKRFPRADGQAGE